MPPPEYGQPIDVDEEARKRKAAENPLLQYFSGAKPQAQAAPTQPQPQRTAATPHVPPKTNVGSGAVAQHPGPTNFTNFGRYQAANRDVSNREAAAYGARATQKATEANRSLEALKARFGTGLASGQVAGPGANAAGGMVEGGFAPATEGPGLVGESTRPGTASGATWQGPSSEDLYAHAKDYSGPMGLAGLEGDKAAYADTLAAEQNLNALGTDEGLQALVQQQNGAGGAGASKLSAGLIGGAGRKDFAALRARFNPEGEMTFAEKEAEGLAKGAVQNSKANSDAWRALGDAAQEREGAKASGETSTQKPLTPAELQANVDKTFAALAPGKRGPAWQEYTPEGKTGLINNLILGNHAKGAYDGLKLDNWEGIGLTANELNDVFDSLSMAEWEKVGAGINNTSAANRAVIYPYLKAKSAQLKRGTNHRQ